MSSPKEHRQIWHKQIAYRQERIRTLETLDVFERLNGGLAWIRLTPQLIAELKQDIALYEAILAKHPAEA
jgi:hypothetical protein